MHVIQASIELYYCERRNGHTCSAATPIFVGYHFHVIGHTDLRLFNYMVRERLCCWFPLDRLLSREPSDGW